MKCRLPAEAWPARPGRNPCLVSSAWRSLAPSAIRAEGTHTSSMIICTPGGRSAASRPASPPARATASRSLGVPGEPGPRPAGAPARICSAAGSGAPAPRGLGPELDQQRGRGRRQLVPALRGAGHVVGGGDQRRGDHDLGRRGARVDAAASTAAAAASRSSKPTRASVVWRAQRDGLEYRLGDEGQRPLRADDQPAEDLQRRVGIQERAQPVAGGVLDLELAADTLGELLVAA